MFKSYFKIAFRNLWRNKAFSSINILGLSIGLACCMLILLYTKDEISYDRFHEKKDHMFRITARILEKASDQEHKTGKTGTPVGPGLQREIPEIREFLRIQTDNFVVKKNNESYTERVLFADKNFFTFFSFPLQEGNPKTVLSDLNSVVLDDETAVKYFGTSHAVGQRLDLEVNGQFQSFLVSGIAKKSPQNSSVKFTILLPFSFNEKINPEHQWLNFFLNTFIVLQSDADPQAVLKKIGQVIDNNSKDQIAELKKLGVNNRVVWGLQPFLQMHLSSDYPAEDELTDASNPVYSYILSGIALFILLIACINFINLTVAQSLKRGKEIGVRKVIGGQRLQLMRQFLGESFVICLIAFSLAIILAQLAMPVFNELSNKRLSLNFLLDFPLVAGFILLFLVTGFTAGFYPAIVLSGFNPVQTLYNRTRLTAKNYLGKALVVLQFSLATCMIIGTLFIYAQFDYLMHTELGYNDKNVAIVSLGGGVKPALAETFKNELSKDPSVELVAAHNLGNMGTIARADGNEISFQYERIDENFLPALKIPVIMGRNFSKDYPTDSTNSVLINESFARSAGWKDPVGKQVDLFWRSRKLNVVGVVRDYHFESLKEKIKPQVFSSEPEMKLGQLVIRISPNNIPKTISFIERTYRKLVPVYPFNYVFKSDLNARQYETEAKWKQIISFGALLAIFISCIGLFGLASLSAEQRVKEIGIRKVLGASSISIMRMISNNFIKLVLLANLIAFPVAWWAVNKWLQNFAYKIDVSWKYFAVSAVIAMVVAVFTISFQSLKAAASNPVKSLRTE